MFDPLDFEKRPLAARLARLRALASVVIFLEHCGQGLWRILSWAAFFTALWLLQIPEAGGNAISLGVLALFLSGVVFFLYKDLPKLRWPGAPETDRRLEEESGLPHRPLETLKDTLANPGKTETRALWHNTREQAFSALSRLRAPWPKPCLASSDPCALRLFSLLLLIVGLTVAGPQAGTRLARGLAPLAATQDAVDGASSAVTLWITPPAYTGIPQIVIQETKNGAEPLKIPEGSVIKAHINGGLMQPVLAMDAHRLPLEKIDGNGNRSWSIEAPVVPGTRLTLRQGILSRAALRYDYVADQPPQISIEKDPEPLPKGALRIPLKIFDDYGMTDLTLHMALAPEASSPPLGAAFQETRPLASAGGAASEIAPVYNLSWHPWAGLPVLLMIEGKDAKGQTGAAPPQRIVLPERSFARPAAQQLIALRKRLIWTPVQASSNAAFELARILSDPAQLNDNPAVFLALRSAAARLAYAPSAESAARVAELLWDAAITIEEGNLPLAARDLHEAQKNLEQTLANPDATDEQVAQALAELEQALASYFQEMFRDLQNRMAEQGAPLQIPPELLQNAVNPEDLAAFLDRLRAASLSGDKNAAKDMLSQLREFTDMLESAQDMSMPEPMTSLVEGIGKLQELIRKQKDLLAKTEQQEKDARSSDSGAGKKEQDAIRSALGALMLESDEKRGEIPESMGMAEIAMGESATHLGQNEPSLSIPYQREALSHLQDSAEDMARQIQKMMQQMTLFSLGASGQLDPLGRPMQEGNGPGFFTGSRVKIPDEAQRKSVQDILKTLRQRSGERQRPDYELEYYRRLMKQF